ncbi:hypothetical protein QL285_028482 [Trifolium repens]|nr:hypothetical protein QL285_028482 [Trifolium repens]
MVVAFLRGCCWLSLVLCGSGPVLVAVVVAVSGGCVAGDSGGDGDYGGSGLVLLGGLGVRGFGSRRLVLLVLVLVTARDGVGDRFDVVVLPMAADLAKQWVVLLKWSRWVLEVM